MKVLVLLAMIFVLTYALSTSGGHAPSCPIDGTAMQQDC